MIFIGYFEGIASQRGIAWRCRDSRSLAGFLGCGPTEMTPDHFSLSQQSDNALPIPFLIVLAFWFFVLFASFGLFTPRNMTTIGVLLICGLSVAGAVFLIVDLSQPLDGLLRISSLSLRDALASLGQ